MVGGANDINAHGAIAGNVYGLSGKDSSKLERVYPVVWKCAFGPVTSVEPAGLEPATSGLQSRRSSN